MAASVVTERRERAGLSAHGAATQLGMTIERLQAIEFGLIVPNEPTSQALCRLFGGTVAEYLDAPLHAESPRRRR